MKTINISIQKAHRIPNTRTMIKTINYNQIDQNQQSTEHLRNKEK